MTKKDCPFCWHSEEVDELSEIITNVRDTLLPLVDSKENECGDMKFCTASSYDCLECLVKRIRKQYEKNEVIHQRTVNNLIKTRKKLRDIKENISKIIN